MSADRSGDRCLVKHRGDPLLAEWVMPVRRLDARDRPDAVKDSDYFANQNSAVKLTHGYTLRKLQPASALRAENPVGFHG